ncbi:exo-beta-1,3-glucanase [Coprinopsis cinerea okayama7|uniref:glucan 1,3-beta-glucosidase n=1 Tax=Coprinopsis cinerea (strain Okayama-7 / 130 / ATCC MYA-4618 / FGSC 9003) TaxID=240176 RepID=A8NBK4_COPC7|nr:exo-beta-1,3-glucanase [Coprinopsis cinerea okayama7\|eukprot:XP_001832202.2 exo-beta-1,3-glucanase [Coprinopsis cinerea okayama7\
MLPSHNPETTQSRERQYQMSLIRDAQLANLSSTRPPGQFHNPYAQKTRPDVPNLPLRPDSSVGGWSKRQKQTRWAAFIIVLGGMAIIALAISLGVYFSQRNKKSPETEDKPLTTDVSFGLTIGYKTGGDGTEVRMNEGDASFVYQNTFGGYWHHNPLDPFKLYARPNSWTPPLNESWTWGQDRIYGVNLGGWLVLEPFITPSLFQKYPGTSDEWSLSEAMRRDEAGGGIGQIEDHYKTFITERDIAEIAGAGLNWVRIPLGFWAIETWDGEPYLERTSWTYFLRAVEWARKYGLRVILDLHTCPGSQNGLNQSGREGSINFLSGNMGIANAERTLYYIRILTQFISQPQYRDVVPVISILNQPAGYAIGVEPISSFHLRAYDLIRRMVTGFKAGPYIAVSGSLLPIDVWNETPVLPGADRVILDVHPFIAFEGINTSSIVNMAVDGERGGIWPKMVCDMWGPAFNQSRRFNGITIGGQFSAATNDCGLFLRSVDIASEHPQCAEYDNWESYNETMKAGIRSFVLASFDAIGDFFWWTWKVGETEDGRIAAPMWSYKLGLDNGWIPRDPRDSIGKCLRLRTTPDVFDGAFQPWQTGDVSWDPVIPEDYLQQHPWPPRNITNAEVEVGLLPTYTSTGSVVTLPPPTFTVTTDASAEVTGTSGLNGWYNTFDRAGGPTPVAGCFYPDAYDASFGEAVPTEACVGPTEG